MDVPALTVPQLLDSLDEPTLIVAGSVVVTANDAARRLFGPRIETSDVRLVVRQPRVLEALLAGEPGDLDVNGIGGFERPWTVVIRRIAVRTLVVRFLDRAAVVAAEKMRVDFVANASHELRTPLSTIMGYAETLADESELEAELRARFAGVILAEAQQMNSLIEDLMNLSRIAADRFVPPQEQVELDALAQDSAERVSGQSGRSDSPIELQIAPDLPRVRGDVPQLRQLLDNLLTNALRYGTGAHGSRVELSISEREGIVRLSVRDHGPGIAPEHLPRLTERFYRVDNARSRASGGTGLGLAIVKHIVERHRGTLDIRSRVGVGTEVIVLLPAVR